MLDRLLADERIEIDAISGTRAGAMNAVVLADGLMAGGLEIDGAAYRDGGHLGNLSLSPLIAAGAAHDLVLVQINAAQSATDHGCGHPRPPERDHLQQQPGQGAALAGLAAAIDASRPDTSSCGFQVQAVSSCSICAPFCATITVGAVVLPEAGTNPPAWLTPIDKGPDHPGWGLYFAPATAK